MWWKNFCGCVKDKKGYIRLNKWKLMNTISVSLHLKATNCFSDDRFTTRIQTGGFSTRIKLWIKLGTTIILSSYCSYSHKYGKSLKLSYLLPKSKTMASMWKEKMKNHNLQYLQKKMLHSSIFNGIKIPKTVTIEHSLVELRRFSANSITKELGEARR